MNAFIKAPFQTIRFDSFSLYIVIIKKGFQQITMLTDRKLHQNIPIWVSDYFIQTAFYNNTDHNYFGG